MNIKEIKIFDFVEYSENIVSIYFDKNKRFFITENSYGLDNKSSEINKEKLAKFELINVTELKEGDIWCFTRTTSYTNDTEKICPNDIQFIVHIEKYFIRTIKLMNDLKYKYIYYLANSGIDPTTSNMKEEKVWRLIK